MKGTKTTITLLLIASFVVALPVFAIDYLNRGTITLPFTRYNHNLHNVLNPSNFGIVVMSLTNSDNDPIQVDFDLYDTDGNFITTFPNEPFVVPGHGAITLDWNTVFEEGNPYGLDPNLESFSGVAVWRGRVDKAPVVLGNIIVVDSLSGNEKSNSVIGIFPQ